MMPRTVYTTREEWLRAAAEEFTADLFEAQGFKVPRYRVGVGFPSAGKRSGVIGECWTRAASGDSTHEIIIRIDRTEAADPQGTLSVLLHEMAHTVAGLDAQHGPGFAAVAKAVGLTGKMTATTLSDDLLEAFRAWTQYGSIGAYPMARFGWTGALGKPGEGPGEGPDDFFRSSGPKTQGTRMLKAWCPNDVTVSADDERSGCGYTVRLTRKWASVAVPVCPNPECERVGIALDLESKE